jgi:hypothetical protein
VGDNLIGCMRYQILPSGPDNSSFSVILEKMYITSSYQKKHYSYKILFELLLFLSRQVLSNIIQLLLVVPVNSWLENKVLSLGFRKIPSLLQHSSYDSSTSSFLSLSFENNQNFYDFISFLKSKET